MAITGCVEGWLIRDIYERTSGYDVVTLCRCVVVISYGDYRVCRRVVNQGYI